MLEVNSFWQVYLFRFELARIEVLDNRLWLEFLDISFELFSKVMRIHVSMENESAVGEGDCLPIVLYQIIK